MILSKVNLVEKEETIGIRREIFAVIIHTKVNEKVIE